MNYYLSRVNIGLEESHRNETNLGLQGDQTSSSCIVIYTTFRVVPAVVYIYRARYFPYRLNLSRREGFQRVPLRLLQLTATVDMHRIPFVLRAHTHNHNHTHTHKMAANP